MFYYAGYGPIIQFGLLCIATIILPPIILRLIKKREFSEKNISNKTGFFWSFISSVCCVLLTIIFSIILNIFSLYNYLVPIVSFLISFVTIETKKYKKYDINAIDLFIPSLVSKIPTIALCYFILYAFFIDKVLFY